MECIPKRPKKYISDEEEEELVDFLVKCASIGYLKTRKDVMSIVQHMVLTKGIETTPSSGWWTAFSRRHIHKMSLTKVRAGTSNAEIISNYFDLYEQTIDTYDLRNHSELIFCMEELEMPLNKICSPWVLEAGRVSLESVVPDEVGVVGCVSGSGHSMPPMVIWKRKSVQLALTEGEVRGTRYSISESGSMTDEIFQDWFYSHFLKYAPRDRPLLLLLDGHSSHFCPETFTMAAKEDVIVFALPPNTTHLSQPLDKGCFGPLKVRWRAVCQSFLSQNPGKVVTRFCFSKLFASAWMTSMTMANVMAGFSTTGIFPIDRSALLKVNESSVEQSCLPFHPMSSAQKPKLVPSATFTSQDAKRFMCELSFSDTETDNDNVSKLQGSIINKC